MALINVNVFIHEKERTQMIQVSEDARTEIQKTIEDKGNNKAVRVYVAGYG